MAVPDLSSTTSGALKARHDGRQNFGVTSRRSNRDEDLDGQPVERDSVSPTERKITMGSEYTAVVSVLGNWYLRNLITSR